MIFFAAGLEAVHAVVEESSQAIRRTEIHLELAAAAIVCYPNHRGEVPPLTVTAFMGAMPDHTQESVKTRVHSPAHSVVAH